MDGSLGTWQAHLAYALVWLSFGALHSLLAHEPLRSRLKRACGAYGRLTYTAIAVVHLVAVAAAGGWLFHSSAWVIWPWPVVGLLMLVHLCGWGLLLMVLRRYETGRLLGTAQLAERARGIEDPSDDEAMLTDGPHAVVRHPLYAAGLLILWGQAFGAFGIATALWGSLYLVVGAALEERRLSLLFGQAYEDYRRAVPPFVPRLRRPH